MKSTHSKDSRLNRRQFLAGTLGTAATLSIPYFVPSSALGRTGAVAPSNRIVMGSIGLGIQGTGLMEDFLRERDVQVVAVCDVRRSQLEKARRIVDTYYKNSDCAAYGDFRELCGRSDVDAVVIATPDHWHALIAIEAAKNGKHMYHEKPIGWSFRAGQKVRETIQRSGVVFQFGTQQRSSRDFRFACELVRSGKIGKLHTILVGVPGGVTVPVQETEPIPKGFDYDMWLGPAPWAPHSFERCRPYTDRPNGIWTQQYSSWYHISDYCLGFIDNWGIHHMDIAQWGGGTEDRGPVEIEGSGVFPTEGLADNALTWKVRNTFADGVDVWHMDNSNSERHPEQVRGEFNQGVLFKGSDGWVFVNRKMIDAEPKSLLQQEDAVAGTLMRSDDHQRNFLDAIRGGSKTICPVDVAVRSDTICQIDNIAIKLGRKLKWDPEKEDFVNDAEASQMLDRPMRSPWHL